MQAILPHVLCCCMSQAQLGKVVKERRNNRNATSNASPCNGRCSLKTPCSRMCAINSRPPCKVSIPQSTTLCSVMLIMLRVFDFVNSLVVRKSSRSQRIRVPEGAEKRCNEGESSLNQNSSRRTHVGGACCCRDDHRRTDRRTDHRSGLSCGCSCCPFCRPSSVCTKNCVSENIVEVRAKIWSHLSRLSYAFAPSPPATAPATVGKMRPLPASLPNSPPARAPMAP